MLTEGAAMAESNPPFHMRAADHRLRRHFAVLSAGISEENLLRSAQPSERDAQILAEISVKRPIFYIIDAQNNGSRL
jgi:hypothetical protein